MTELKVGTVTHYYDQLGVAIVDLTADLHLKDRIRISGSNEFSQIVESMQMEHEQVEVGHAGDTVGLQVRQPVVPGDEIVIVNY